RVLDVFKNESGQVVHRVDRDVPGPAAPAKIDRDRRLAHMQHHSAQHILSAALEAELGLETLSAKISGDSPSTIDVPDTELAPGQLERAELRANQVVFENRTIRTYFITDAEVSQTPFRRPPKVSGSIRVVEVDRFDVSACGGTHCPQTGMIGLIKILRTERKNQKRRIHFAAGEQALRQFQVDRQLVTELGNLFSTGPGELAGVAAAQLAELRQARVELNELRAAALELEAHKLRQQAAPGDGGRWIRQMFAKRPAGELRELGKLLQQDENLVALLAAFDGKKLSLVVSCGRGTPHNAGKLLNARLAKIGGRGGGDARLAQGGGPATPDEAAAFFDE
ncbi:MAG: hypothetical protein D6768_02465, partial [Chloroflexi bacterium]